MADREIEAMSAVSGAVADLEEQERGRVLRWAAERYGVVLASHAMPAARMGRNGASVAVDNDVTEEEIAAQAPTFEHFAELFAAAQPKTNEDKALVAAYWLQAIQREEKWQALQLTKELQNLGHRIPNISDALTNSMKKKPQRVIQLQKSGSSRQGRKTYKMTHEGLVYVQGMLGGGR